MTSKAESRRTTKIENYERQLDVTISRCDFAETRRMFQYGTKHRSRVGSRIVDIVPQILRRMQEFLLGKILPCKTLNIAVYPVVISVRDIN